MKFDPDLFDNLLSNWPARLGSSASQWAYEQWWLAGNTAMISWSVFTLACLASGQVLGQQLLWGIPDILQDTGRQTC